MRLSNGTAHLAVVGSCEPAPDEVARASETTTELRVKLSSVDKLALDGLADPRDVAALIGWAEDSATALAGSDRDAARLRLISRAVATERARLLVLEAMLDERLTACDWNAVREIRPVIATTSRVLCALLREHAAACHVRRHDVVVAVAHVDSINLASRE